VARRADDAYSHGNTRRRRNDATAHPAELGGGEGILHRPSADGRELAIERARATVRERKL